ncbi:MAG: hypothetical protein M9962_07635 [Oligoflexia bacterium]|nr:hypothetical protein [Oligoflexia bacterium]
MKTFYFIALLICFSSCAPSTSEKYNSASSEAEILTLLNEREYHKAIWLIEAQYTKNPKKTDIKFYLAQAYLGKAGFEPLEFIDKIHGDQNKTQSNLWNQFFKNCETRAIFKNESISLHCLFKRIYFNTPEVSSGDFATARSLMRSAYPNPEHTSTWNNTLIGMVELVSLIKRSGDLYMYGKNILTTTEMKKNALNIQWLKAQFTQALIETNECAIRGSYSGDKISKFILKYKSESLYEALNDRFQLSQRLGTLKLLSIEHNLKNNPDLTINQIREKILAALDDEERQH